MKNFGKMATHKEKGYNGRIISDENGFITIAVFGCHGFYKDYAGNFTIYN